MAQSVGYSLIMTLRALLDTNAFYENKWRKTEAMKTFANLCRTGLLQCFIPHVVLREITSQGKAHQDQEIATMSAAFKKLKKYSLPPAQYEILTNAIDNLDQNKGMVLEKPALDFQSWCVSIAAVHVPMAGDHPGRVLDSYFEGSAPFKKLKSREDFPDAFIYEIVKDLAVESLLIVCQDDNLRKACERFPNVKGFKTIDKLLADPQVASLIVEATAEDDELAIVGFVENVNAQDSTKPDWVETAKKQLAAIGRRPETLRQGLVGAIIDELLRTQVQSSLIASSDHKGEVLLAAIGDIQFDLEDASYYGDGKFSFAFAATGTLSLQYYVDEYAFDRVRGKIVSSKRVYKDVEQFQTDFDAHVYGRAILQIDSSSVESGKILQNYKMFEVDEIQKIVLSDDRDPQE